MGQVFDIRRRQIRVGSGDGIGDSSAISGGRRHSPNFVRVLGVVEDVERIASHTLIPAAAESHEGVVWGGTNVCEIEHGVR